jgi:hypothetical protein
MAQQIINIGALPNDGSGDPLRTAFNKINNNFAELFTAPFNTLSANTTGPTPNQTIFSAPATAFTQGKFQINSVNLLTNDSQNITLTAAKCNDNVSVKFSGYGTLFTGAPVTQYDMDIATGNLRILCSPLTTANLTHFIAYQLTTAV